VLEVKKQMPLELQIPLQSRVCLKLKKTRRFQKDLVGLGKDELSPEIPRPNADSGR
jgi:hypothetical protein